jgi:hypothetical protein
MRSRRRLWQCVLFAAFVSRMPERNGARLPWHRYARSSIARRRRASVPMKVRQVLVGLWRRNHGQDGPEDQQAHRAGVPGCRRSANGTTILPPPGRMAPGATATGSGSTYRPQTASMYAYRRWNLHSIATDLAMVAARICVSGSKANDREILGRMVGKINREIRRREKPQRRADSRGA